MRSKKLHSPLVLGILIALGAKIAAEPLPAAKPESVGMSSQRLASIGPVLKADIDKGGLPGAVVAVARKGKLVYYEAFGFLDRERGVPMPKDAIFAIASMTKPLTAVGALILYEESRLMLTEPVTQYLPQLDKMQVAIIDPSDNRVIGTEPPRRTPTLQDLMRHTAGMTYGNGGDTDLHKKYPQSSNVIADVTTGPEFLATLGSLPLFYHPGSVWDYGLGFDVLGLLVESVTGQSLGRFLDERLFQPLGMVDTCFVLSDERAKRFAKPLPTNPETGARRINRDPTRPRKFECGGGCAFATADDYVRFAQMLLNRGQLSTMRILGRKTVEYMTADQLGPEVNLAALRDRPIFNGYGFGLSVAVRRSPGVSSVMGSAGDYHWAGAGGTFFWVDPQEELAVVFMAATPDVTTRNHYRQVIVAQVLQALE